MMMALENNSLHLKSRVVWFVLIAFCVIILGPLLYNLLPAYIFSPDIQYVKGKVLCVMEGEPYADPVTGYSTFHPPYYHYFLAALVLIGFGLDHALVLAIILATALSVFFLYKLTKARFNKETAVYTVLLLPLIAEFINNANLLLASAFYFSMPVFLAGLWLYYRVDRQYRFTVGYSLLWGVAFLISPGYLFLIGLFLLSEALLRRRKKHFFVAIGTMLVTLIPFYIHAYVIFSNNMFGTAAFSLWPGLPDISFFSTLGRTLLIPGGHKLAEPIVWAGLIAALGGIAAMIKTRRNNGLIIIAAIAYFLTFYHYLPQYAIRIHFFILILLLPLAVGMLLGMKKKRLLARGVILCFAVIGVYYHYSDLLGAYRGQREDLPVHQAMMTRQVLNQLYTNMRTDEFILVSAENYRLNVLPYIPAHALRAWRSGEYYQLKTDISDRLNSDYDTLMQCSDTICLNRFCDKYDIQIAFVCDPLDEDDYPVFDVVDEYWHNVYDGAHCRIYRKR